MKNIINELKIKCILLFLLLSWAVNAQNPIEGTPTRTLPFNYSEITPANGQDNENQPIPKKIYVIAIQVPLKPTGTVYSQPPAPPQVTTLNINVSVTTNAATSQSIVSLNSASASGTSTLPSSYTTYLINNFVQQIQGSYGRSWGIEDSGSDFYNAPNLYEGIPIPRDPQKEADAAMCAELICPRGTKKDGCFCDEEPCYPTPSCSNTEVLAGCECVPKVDPCKQFIDIFNINAGQPMVFGRWWMN